MSATITLTLPNDVQSALDDATRREGITPTELISAAVKEYLFVRQFRSLRERLIPAAQKQGIQTDQDVFDRVS